MHALACELMPAISLNLGLGLHDNVGTNKSRHCRHWLIVMTSITDFDINDKNDFPETIKSNR